eukprot:3355670-Amphidinium_carterae.2
MFSSPCDKQVSMFECLTGQTDYYCLYKGLSPLYSPIKRCAVWDSVLRALTETSIEWQCSEAYIEVEVWRGTVSRPLSWKHSGDELPDVEKLICSWRANDPTTKETPKEDIVEVDHTVMDSDTWFDPHLRLLHDVCDETAAPPGKDESKKADADEDDSMAVPTDDDLPIHTATLIRQIQQLGKEG